MIKKIICFLWGHVYTAKAATGNILILKNFITGDEGPVSLYKWEPLEFCPRCSKPNPHYAEWKKKNAEWDDYRMAKPQPRPGMTLNEGLLPNHK
jgi:hypothetical protein